MSVLQTIISANPEPIHSRMAVIDMTPCYGMGGGYISDFYKFLSVTVDR